jgi:ParB-like chromosome segregation protein Spo0J
MPDGPQLFPVVDPADELPVHPVADLFAMMPDADLAADIKANGQRFPIMLDAAGELLIDGRNRRAACRMIGVEPVFAHLPESEDLVAYIWSVNVARRHMNKGQIALAAARARSLAAKDLRLTQKLAAKLAGVSEASIAQADIVLKYAPDLVQGIIAGDATAREAPTL